MAAKLRHFGSLASIFGRTELNYNTTRILRCTRQFRTNIQLLGNAIKIRMPALSPTMTEGTIVKWHKQEGDVVSPGDLLCDIQTDKAVVSLETEEEGTLAKILKGENSKEVQLGSLIALMVEEGDDWKNVTVPADDNGDAAALPPSTQPDTPTSLPHISSSSHGIGPAVRTLLDLYSINAENVQGTGPHGILLKGDLLQYIKSKSLQPAPTPSKPPTPIKVPTTAPTPIKISTQAPPPVKPAAPASVSAIPTMKAADTEDFPLTNMRKVIARRLTESKTTIPHSYATISCCMDKLLELRKDLLNDGIKVSVNDFIVKASAVALQKVPQTNAVWGGEAGRVLENIDICVAVATDNGLITPIVKNAIDLGLAEISSTIRDLAIRARDNKLKPEEFQGGTFTISNLGMFGITEFSAVINPPQACILAVGSSRLVLNEDAQPETHMTVTLSADARIVDDFLAAQFLDAFREVMEEPMLMLTQSVPVSLDVLFAK